VGSMSKFINARKSDIAESVILISDPVIVKKLSEKYLRECKLVNNSRFNLAYSGYYNDEYVTIMASGIGMPSIATYVHELYEDYSVNKIIRVDTCTSYYEEIDLRDIILVEKAYTRSNFSSCYDNEKLNIVKASVLLSQKIVNKAHSEGIDLKIGNINTVDTKYSYQDDPKIKENFCFGYDTETFALYYLSKRFDKQASTLLFVSEILDKNNKLTDEQIENMYDRLTLLALDSLK
jgi:Purine-nucleoside phosphorylase